MEERRITPLSPEGRGRGEGYEKIFIQLIM